MSLLREIQQGATDSTFDISTVLRKAKILAARLKNPEFEAWVDSELAGYAREVELPSYRNVDAMAYGRFIAANTQAKLAIPSSVLPPKFRDWGERCFFRQPIAAVSATAMAAVSSEDHEIAVPWPAEMFTYAEKAYTGECVGVWLRVSASQLIAIVDAVRNRLLSFALAIEAENPDAGDADIRSIPVDPERVTQVFLTTIYGGMNNVAAGSSHVTQHQTGTILLGDLGGLEKGLEAAGARPEEIAELKSQLASADTLEKKQAAADGWLGKTARNAFGATRAFAIELSAKALAEYFRPGP